LRVEVIKEKEDESSKYLEYRKIKERLRKYDIRKEGGCSILFPSFSRVTKSPAVNPFAWLFERCCKEHPDIETTPGVLGGIPRIRRTRLSVGQVLGRLYVLGSIRAVAQYYKPDISEEQIKEAIAYAQDFMEIAGDPESSETYD
jgi:uncharacterized protein (DUF433 family)